MIFKFFKRSPPPAPPKPKRRRPKSSTFAELPTEPSQLPQVTEGSDHQDWALWESSVAMLDSQMQSLNSQVVKRVLPEPEVPTDFQPVEAYARVKKKDP